MEEREEDDFFADESGIPEIIYRAGNIQNTLDRRGGGQSNKKRAGKKRKWLVVCLLFTQTVLLSLLVCGAVKVFFVVENNIVPHLDTEIVEPLENLLKNIDPAQVASFVHNLPQIQTDLEELVELGRNITNFLHHFPPWHIQ